jgi:hypothetical protein
MNTDEKYYADGEDALDMRVYFKDVKINKKTGGAAGETEEEKKHEEVEQKANQLEAEALATGDEVKNGGQ